MANIAARVKRGQLSLSLRRLTRHLHDVSEERFGTLSRLAPGKVASHLVTLKHMLFAWHDAGSGKREADNVPRLLARAMAGHEAAIIACGTPTRPPPPSPLARFTLANRGEAIGSAYTLCGAALGLRMALGAADLSTPEEQQLAANLAQAGAVMEGRWRGICRAIDLWGLEHPDLQGDALAGASTAFCVALVILDAMVEQSSDEGPPHV